MSEADYDVVVLGTGAAALTAAVRASAEGANVGLFEKADVVGGTSAWSGGMVWIPNNPHMAELGIEDSTEEALTYLMSLSQGLIDVGLATALLEAGPELVSWLEANTPVRFRIIEDFPDYHSEQPGAKAHGGRSLETPLYPFVELGEWAARVSMGPQMSGNIMLSETALGRGAPNGVPADERGRRKIRDERGTGQSLIGPLLRACLDRGIEPRTGMRAVALVTDDEHRVVGVDFETASGPVRVHAGAVILATGGFEWDADLVRSFVRGPLVRAASVPTNTGDGLRMAMRIGAGLGNMREAWWVPIIDVPVDGRGTVAWQVNGERTRPHCIMVNSRGQRFTNEAANYNALGAAFHTFDVTTFEYANHPAWMIFDDHYLSQYGLARYKSGRGPVPEWITSGTTVGELAARIEVPADALAATISRWNEHAVDGRDPDFGRGLARNDRWWGDPAQGDTPQATIGPLDTPPYYAVRVYSGALGTKGGPQTDTNGQVLDVDGRRIPGLYAAGNVMASVMGMTYGGAGGTLAPAMVFGFLAGQHAARNVPAEASR